MLARKIVKLKNIHVSINHLLATPLCELAKLYFKDVKEKKQVCAKIFRQHVKHYKELIAHGNRQNNYFYK